LLLKERAGAAGSPSRRALRCQ